MLAKTMQLKKLSEAKKTFMGSLMWNIPVPSAVEKLLKAQV